MTQPKHTDDASLDDLVRELIGAVKMLTNRVRRKRISDAVLGAVVAAMLVAGLLYYFVELPSRRADTRSQIRDLACYSVRLRPPGYSATSDALRKRYTCPPFVAADLPAGAPTVAPSIVQVPGPTRTVTRPAAPRATVTHAGVTATRTVAAPAVTVTRVHTVHGPTRTATRTARATVTVTRGLCVPVVSC